MVEQKDFNSAFGKVGCHIENVGEILTQFDSDYVTEDGNIIKLNLAGYIGVSQLLINKLKESMEECEGKTIEIDLGDGPAATVLEGILKALGFNL